MRKRSLVRVLVGAGVGVILVASTLVGGGPARALTSTTHPQLTRHHLIRTSPFAGSSTSVRDNEGSAYVGRDNALWMASDNDDALFEVDRSTGRLRRTVSESAFADAPRHGIGTPAGSARTEDFEALAYDAQDDVLYAFSGSTSSTPTVFRLTRGADNRLQVRSWQPLPSEFTAAGWRSADAATYVANGATVRSYAFATNGLGPAFSIGGLSGIQGVDFDDVTGDLVAVTTDERLWRASMSTRSLRPGWQGISLTGLGLADTRAVEVIGEQVLVTDGLDSRPAGDPASHAVFVIDVTPARPDGRIRRGAGALVGNGVYNLSGINQTRSGATGRGGRVTFYASIQNDADYAERIRLRGQASTAAFTVRYLNRAGQDLTRPITRGTFRIPVLAPQASVRLTVVVTVRQAAARGASVARTLTAISTTHPTVTDTVRFITSRA